MLPLPARGSSMEPASQESCLGAELPAPSVPGSCRSCHPALKMRFQLLPSGQGSLRAQGEAQQLLLQTCPSSCGLPLPEVWLPFSVSALQSPEVSLQNLFCLSPSFRALLSHPSALYVRTRSCPGGGSTRLAGLVGWASWTHHCELSQKAAWLVCDTLLWLLLRGFHPHPQLPSSVSSPSALWCESHVASSRVPPACAGSACWGTPCTRDPRLHSDCRASLRRATTA